MPHKTDTLLRDAMQLADLLDSMFASDCADCGCDDDCDCEDCCDGECDCDACWEDAYRCFECGSLDCDCDEEDAEEDDDDDEDDALPDQPFRDVMPWSVATPLKPAAFRLRNYLRVEYVGRDIVGQHRIRLGAASQQPIHVGPLEARQLCEFFTTLAAWPQ